MRLLLRALRQGNVVISTEHPSGYKIALVPTVMFGLLDLFKRGCSNVLPLSYVFVERRL